ncbi:MAG: hypothetical protein ACREPF_12115 [Rhodanobacteraceae bacterium]
MLHGVRAREANEGIFGSSRRCIHVIASTQSPSAFVTPITFLFSPEAHPASQRKPLHRRHSGAARAFCAQSPESSFPITHNDDWIPGSAADEASGGPGMTS